ncbi:MAG: polysaccharide pyruvyl transferase family protein [Clostridia bacterium]|nr:polysaccharide pyruvyl transferase family protein [Clostridia bacterium]
MKYGLIVYKDTENIGDDIQSYVAKRFLPQVDYYIEREELDEFLPEQKEEVAVIMNGWFLHKKYNFPPSEYIVPLLTSMHFATGNKWTLDKTEYLRKFTADYLNKYGPVGARDHTTKAKFEKVGIDCYFSGCMTLTINKFDNIKKGDYICAVDLNEDSIKRLKELYGDKEIRYITHRLDPNENKKLSYEQRLNNVEELLKVYQGAEFVVTTRLHCALPCVSLGTPVVLLNDEDSINRLGSFSNIIQLMTEEQFSNGEIELNFSTNSEYFLGIRNPLVSKCEKFIADVSKREENTSLLDIEEYKKVNRIDYIRWKKDICEIEINDVLKDLEGYKRYQKELLEHNLNLENENKKLTKDLESIKSRKIYRIIEFLKGRDNEKQS